MSGGRLRVFLDEGVPDSVGRAFAELGHDVIYLRDALVPGSPDAVVWAMAQANDAILVALDHDMRAIAKRHGASNARFKTVSLIMLDCPEPQAADRVRTAMPFIEHEWRVGASRIGRRLFVEIGTNVLRTYR